MKILSILSSVSPMGGSSKSFLTLAEALVRKKGVTLYVTVPSISGIARDLQNIGVKVFRVPVRHHTWPPCKTISDIFHFIPRLLYHVIVNNNAYRKIFRISNEIKPDIIHTNVGVLNVGFAVAQKLRIPHVYHLREFQWEDFSMRIIPNKKVFLQSLESYYSNIIYITKQIQQAFPISHKNKGLTAVIYNAIKKSQSTDDGQETINKEKVILFVGRLTEKKGVYDILSAYHASGVKKNGYKLKLVGGALTADLQKINIFIQKHNLEQHIELIPPVSNVDEIMKKSKFLIMASSSEAFGRVTAEAMLNRCLVIGNNVAGTQEQFDNGLHLTGAEIGIRYHNVKDLAEKIIFATNLEQESYSDIVNRAYLTVKTLYSEETHMNEVFSFFEKVIHNYEN